MTNVEELRAATEGLIDHATEEDCGVCAAYVGRIRKALNSPASGALPADTVSREDFNRLWADLARAKNLLVRLYDKHPAARDQIAGSTGSWFVWGADRDAEPAAALASREAVEPNPAVPVPATLLGAESKDVEQAHDQCCAVIHMANALAEIYRARAATLETGLGHIELIGQSSAEVMEWLGDTLNGMDAVDESDAWIEPIIQAAHVRWPIAPAALASPQVAPEAKERLRWCDHCGEGITTFCRSRMLVKCPSFPAAPAPVAPDLTDGQYCDDNWWRGWNAAVRAQVDAESAAPAPAAPTPAVKMPESADEAVLMTLLGHRWLVEHAPERLTKEGREGLQVAPTPAQPSEDARDAARYRFLRANPLNGKEWDWPYIHAAEDDGKHWGLTLENADAAIDAAMSATLPSEPEGESHV